MNVDNFRIFRLLDDISCLRSSADLRYTLYHDPPSLSAAGAGMSGAPVVIDWIGLQGVASQLHASGCSNVVFVTPARYEG